MPKVKISEYSATANSNTDVASINIDEGCAPSGINNAIRAVMGHLKDFQQGTNGDPFNGPVNGTLGATTASTANVTTLTTSSTVTHNGGTANGVAYLDGSKVMTTGSALVFDGTNLLAGTTTTTNNLRVQQKLAIVHAGSSTYAGMAITGYSGTNAGTRPLIDIQRSRGTTDGSMTKVESGDVIGSLIFRGSDGSAFADVAEISVAIDGATGAGDVPGRITFATSADGSSSPTERARIDSSGNLGIGTTSPTKKLSITGTGNNETSGSIQTTNTNAGTGTQVGLWASNGTQNAQFSLQGTGYTAYGALEAGNAIIYNNQAITLMADNASTGIIKFATGGNTERARIDSSGNLLVGKTAVDFSVAGVVAQPSGVVGITRSGGVPLIINRLSSDGDLVNFQQDGTLEGSISVSGTTVSYNGGHLSRWAQTTAPKDESIVKGTVLSNLDEMNVYTDADGNPVDNEQLNKVKVSDVEGDANVAGVFVNWTHDDAHDVDEINMAMTGDMIIRIAQGTTVQRGDLLMSAGDGTAKPQGDDIVRSKTVAKVTSTHVTCTYADGSYCVPCVLMAC